MRKIELTRGGEIAAEGLLDNHARVGVELGAPERFDHRFEERGRNGEVERGPLRVAERLLDGREGGGVFVVSADILDERKKMFECGLVIDAAGPLDAVRDAAMDAVHAPLGEGDADDRDVEYAALDHGVERGEDHFVGKVAGYSEDYQRIGLRLAHAAPPVFSAAFS
jgi:hypothetical protein